MEPNAGSRSQPDDNPLAWLSRILWPDETARLVVDRRRGSESNRGTVVAGGDGQHRVGFRWWAWPNPATAEILIPATSSRAARTAVRRYHDGFDLRRRFRSLGAEALMTVPGLAPRLLGRNLVAASGPAADGLLTDLMAELSDEIGVRELHAAITLSRPKSNRKPVLQLIDQDGTCVGWAKLGWNDWTKTLVANEADWLSRPGAPPLRTPRVQHRSALGGSEVVITTGVTATRWPQRRFAAPPSALFHAIADLGARGHRAVADTAWWQSVEAVMGLATPIEAQAVDVAVSAATDAEIEVGAWHGDLTPWNIMSPARPASLVRRRGSAVYQVIDWEFAADGVPFGFDLCHFHTQVAVELKGMVVGDALDYSARLSPQGLARLGVDPAHQLLVFRLYLVELIRRTLQLRAAGLPVDNVHQGAAATRRLDRGVPDLSEPVGPAPT